MNNQQFNTSKPVSEQDFQAGSSEVESSVSGSEPQQPSSSSQPENLDLPSCSSSEVENGAAGNETDKTSSEDEPESVSPTAISLSVSNITDRVNALIESLLADEPTAISLSVPNIIDRVDELIESLFAEEQRAFLRVLLASSCLRRGNRFVFYWEESIIGRHLHYRFRRALSNCRSPLVITHREKSFLEESFRRPPYGIPTAIVNLFNLTDSPLLAPCRSGQSTEALEMALARITLKKFVGVVVCESRSKTFRKTSGTCEPDASSELLDSQIPPSDFQILVNRYIPIIRSLSEIPRTSESNASSELRDSQPSSSASENGVHESQIVLKEIESGEDCFDTESMTSENTLKDGSSDDTQSSEMELKNEENADDPNLDEDSLVTEALDRDSANPLLETMDVSPEESSEESSEGTSAEKSRNDLK